MVLTDFPKLSKLLSGKLASVCRHCCLGSGEGGGGGQDEGFLLREPTSKNHLKPHVFFVNKNLLLIPLLCIKKRCKGICLGTFKRNKCKFTNCPNSEYNQMSFERRINRMVGLENPQPAPSPTKRE